MFEFISRLFDDKDPLIIMPFGGYANATHLFAQARVLEDEGIQVKEEDNLFKNFFNSIKRFETDEKEGATVVATVGKLSFTLTSDNEGYIYLFHPHQMNLRPAKTTSWLAVNYQLLLNSEIQYSIDDEIMIPGSEISYGIISDMDDTVIQTGLSSTLKWRVVVNSFLKQSVERMPLEGTQELFDILKKGASGMNDNPFFYLSNSPWNLHEYLQSFLDHYKFPKGVLLLRDIGFENPKKERFQERNKYLKISHILNTYPSMNFILIGDAADLDHEIYIEIARKFPKKIKAIIIREVDKPKKMKKVRELINSAKDVPVSLISSSKEGIDYLKKLNLIK